MTNMLFEEWLQSSKKWGQSRLLAVLRVSNTQRRSGTIKWLTRAQLLVKYGDESVVGELVNRKKQSNDTRRHPDLPDRDDLVLYRVWDSYDETDTQERFTGTTLQLESEADKALVEEFMKHGVFKEELAKGAGMDAHGRPKPGQKLPRAPLSDSEAQVKKLGQLLRSMANDLVDADAWPSKSESIPENMRQQLLKDISLAAAKIKDERERLVQLHTGGGAASAAAVQPIKDAEEAREGLKRAIGIARKLMATPKAPGSKKGKAVTSSCQNSEGS